MTENCTYFNQALHSSLYALTARKMSNFYQNIILGLDFLLSLIEIENWNCERSTILVGYIRNTYIVYPLFCYLF